ncbi:MAG: glycogen/starch/alpha-glucan phosphorylase, partial [Varibaculum cambriense]|nr:glycogen/starch/alpha-glucan phosphorylase [Varibaculum cambriense]
MADNLTHSLGSFTRSISGRRAEDSTPMEFWTGMSQAIVERIAENWEATTEKYAAGRQEHYFSAEFLMGRALLNNLDNLELLEQAKEATNAFGMNLTDVLEAEHDASLGNGGLGRLAACFLDSCATMNLPVRGYGILYRYGLFKQAFENGNQREHPDPWMEEGYP